MGRIVKPKVLYVYTPFEFSQDIEPRRIITVGDQVLSEHIFAAHFIRNPVRGLIDVFSNVEIDREKKR